MPAEELCGDQGMGVGFQQQQFYAQQGAGGVQGLQPMPFMGNGVGPQLGFMNGATMPLAGPMYPQPQMPQYPAQASHFASGPKMPGSFF